MGHVRSCRNYRKMIKKDICYTMCPGIKKYSKTRIVRNAYQVLGSPLHRTESHIAEYLQSHLNYSKNIYKKGRKHMKKYTKHDKQ